MVQDITIRPQPGPQEEFLKCTADIVIFGGSAGGGKTWAMLMDAMRYCIAPPTPGYGAVLLRKSYQQIEQTGGLKSASDEIYPHAGAEWSQTRMRWKFPCGATVGFAHLDLEKDKQKFQGAEIPWIGFDELTHFCLTPDHDVLTGEGWKPIANVTTADRVYSLMPDGSCEYREVTDTHRYSVSEELVEVNQRRGVSFCATKNHRVMIQRQDSEKSYGFVTADHLTRTIQQVPRCGRVARFNRGGNVSFPKPSGRGIGRNANLTLEPVPIKDWLEFLGWYLSEGGSFLASKSRGGTSPCVSIRQTQPNSGLADLMDRIPWRVRPDGDGGYKIYSRQLYDSLKPLGNRHTKRIPRWIIDECGPDELRVLWDAFVEGDGYRKRGGVTIGLCNEGLRDDLQEVATMMGMVATAGVQHTKSGHIAYTLYVSQETRTVTHIKPKNCNIVEYDGDVYCLSVDCPELPDFTSGGKRLRNVPGGNFLIRRNGRVSFTGNSSSQFFYLMSRNRSTTGVPSRIRATCNPDSTSWVAELIQWWIDQDTGFPIPERDGVVRFFVRTDEGIITASSESALWEKTQDFYGGDKRKFLPKTLTFIRSKLEDNQMLMEKDPSYMASLANLPLADRQRLLDGNWLVSTNEGAEWEDHPEYFDRGIWTEKWPDNFISSAIFIDPSKGKTNRSDYSAIVFVGLRQGKMYVHSDIKRRPAEDIVRDAMRMYSEYQPNMMGIEENNFQDLLAPIFDQECEKQGLPPFEIYMVRSIEKKEARIRSLGPFLERQKIKLHKSKNSNRILYQQLKDFGIKGVHDDGPDALEGAIRVLRALGTDPVDEVVDHPEDDEEPEVEYAL